MSEDADVLIERKENELQPLRSRMEELTLEFIKDTYIFATEWYRKTAKEYVTKYSEVTLNMKEEKITRMKTQVNQLILTAEKTVLSELDKPDLWWHQKPTINNSIDQYNQISDKYPEILDRAVRRALGQLGVILENFRFHVTVSGNQGAYEEFWFEHLKNGQIAPYFPHLLKWSEEMQETIRKYNAQYTKAVTVFMEIQVLKEQKKKRLAMEKWDSM
jgi:hypothetical protein